MRRLFIVSIMSAVIFAGCAKSRTGLRMAPAAPKEIAVQRVYFPFAAHFLTLEMERELDKNIEWLKENGSAYVILEGHCDDIGPGGFNMELGDRRARSVKAYMLEKGISNDRVIMVVSYGSKRPLNNGRRIEDLRWNRRVEFVIR